MPTSKGPDDPRFHAAVDLLGRSGAETFQIRYSDDPEPVVWVVDAKWKAGRECAGALNPLDAILRLLEQVMDGGLCTHCHRPTGVCDDWTQEMPMTEVVCWYMYDPEMQTFRRGCEGDTPRRGKSPPRKGARR